MSRVLSLLECLGRDWTYSPARSLLLSRCIDFLKNTPKENTFDVRSVIEMCCTFANKKNLHQFNELFALTNPRKGHDSYWRIIIKTTNDSNVLNSFLRAVVLNHVKITQQFLDFVANRHDMIQHTNQEEFLNFWSLVFALDKKSLPEVFAENYSLAIRLKNALPNSPLSSFYRLAIGSQNHHLMSSFEFFFGAIFILKNDSFASSYSQQYELDLIDVLSLAITKCAFIYDFSIWTQKSQLMVYSFLQELFNNSLKKPTLSRLHLMRLNEIVRKLTGDMSSEEKADALEINWFDGFDQLSSWYPNQFRLNKSLCLRVFNMQDLRSLELYFRQSQQSSELKALSIIHANNITEGIGDEGTLILSRIVSANHFHVHCIDISFNNVTDPGAIGLFDALKGNSFVQKVNSSFNSISDASIPAILDCSLNDTLKNINLSNNSFSELGITVLSSSLFSIKFHLVEQKLNLQQRTKLYPNGDFFEGLLMNGVRHGHGVCYFANGEKYEGEWEDDTRSGKGVHMFIHSKYVGEWKEDMYHGNGAYHYADGSVYTGEWIENKKNGHGVQVYATGAKYDGTWKDNQRHGNGTYYDSNGKIDYSGEWSEGEKKI
jgi:hypothetical protein